MDPTNSPPSVSSHALTLPPLLPLSLRESPCLSVSSPLPLLLHHPAVQSLLHSPHHPLPPPPGPAQGVCPIRLRRRLGAVRGTGERSGRVGGDMGHTQTVRVSRHTNGLRPLHFHTIRCTGLTPYRKTLEYSAMLSCCSSGILPSYGPQSQIPDVYFSLPF